MVAERPQETECGLAARVRALLCSACDGRGAVRGRVSCGPALRAPAGAGATAARSGYIEGSRAWRRPWRRGFKSAFPSESSDSEPRCSDARDCPAAVAPRQWLASLPRPPALTKTIEADPDGPEQRLLSSPEALPATLPLPPKPRPTASLPAVAEAAAAGDRDGPAMAAFLLLISEVGHLRSAVDAASAAAAAAAAASRAALAGRGAEEDRRRGGRGLGMAGAPGRGCTCRLRRRRLSAGHRKLAEFKSAAALPVDTADTAPWLQRTLQDCQRGLCRAG
jgi:hypothetical protein